MSHVHENVEKYGRWTYRGAWILEIIAASIVISTGIFLVFKSYELSKDVIYAELVLDFAPFFIVALDELTKIPIATLLYASYWV